MFCNEHIVHLLQQAVPLRPATSPDCSAQQGHTCSCLASFCSDCCTGCSSSSVSFKLLAGAAWPCFSTMSVASVAASCCCKVAISAAASSTCLSLLLLSLFCTFLRSCFSLACDECRQAQVVQATHFYKTACYGARRNTDMRCRQAATLVSGTFSEGLWYFCSGLAPGNADRRKS